MNGLPSNIKIFRGDAQSKVGLPKNHTVDDEIEIHCGAGSRIGIRSLAVKGHGNKIIVGDNSLVRGAIININGKGCTLKIGSNFRCGPTRFVVYEKSITIGDGVLFSHGITIRTSDMHSIIDIETNAVTNPPQDVIIADRVWIGQDSLINKGTIIGSDTVIGGRAVVAGEIPANVVAAGVPARVVRHGIRWSGDPP